VEPQREALGVREPAADAALVAVGEEDRHRVDVCEGQEDALPVRLTVLDTEKDPDTVPERLCVRVRLGDALALEQGEAEGLREGEGVPVPLSEAVGEVEEQRVTDTEAVPLLVNGRVVPMAEAVREAIRLRDAIELEGVEDVKGDKEDDVVTDMEEVWLGQGVGELEGKSVEDTEAERVGLEDVLIERVSDPVTDADEVKDGLALAV